MNIDQFHPDSEGNEWGWTNDETESRLFATEEEARKDAEAWLASKEAEEQERLEHEAEARIYGTYEQQHRMRGHE